MPEGQCYSWRVVCGTNLRSADASQCRDYVLRGSYVCVCTIMSVNVWFNLRLFEVAVFVGVLYLL